MSEEATIQQLYDRIKKAADAQKSLTFTASELRVMAEMFEEWFEEDDYYEDYDDDWDDEDDDEL